MSERKPLWLLAAPAIFLFLWSGGYVVAKIGLSYAEPLSLLVLRFFLVLVLMGAIALFVRPPLPEKAADWGHLAVVGFLMQSVHFGMVYLAMKAGVAAGTAALILSLNPVLVAVGAPYFVAERVSWKQWLGLMLGLCGAAVVIVSRSDIDPPSLLGFTCAALGLSGIAAATLWEKRFGLSHHPVTANLIGYGAGFLGLLPFALALESFRFDWSFEFGLVLVYLVIGNSVIAVGLLLAMIRAGAASQVSSLFFLTAPVAAVMAWLSLGDAMPMAAWVGMALAATGVFIATRPRARTDASSEEPQPRPR
ncbi:MAG: DMT family transporter [Pseudomonadota bacterium]